MVGAGPAAFFVAEQLLKQGGLGVRVDMFDRLPTPFGLVRFGVAPDHPRIKEVTRTFEKVLRDRRTRFFGNVEIGCHVSWAELCEHYHQICVATGAQTDRRMNIPGEDLAGSYSAADFVAWYNGHPHYSHRQFDLSAERAVVVGVGNVALDVARMLSRNITELERTDIADHALDALRASRVREVVLLGRRGPAQAAFSATELRELDQVDGVDVCVAPEELALDALSCASVEAAADRGLERKLELLSELSSRPRSGSRRRVVLRFLVSPVELIPDDAGRVAAVRLVTNELVAGGDGNLLARPTARSELLPAQLVLRSIGYRGVPLAGLPFDERRAVIPSKAGRVSNPASGAVVLGAYVSGWIKRQPVGVIGSNKPDAAETVKAMLEDAAAGRVMHGDRRGIPEDLIRKRRPEYLSSCDWVRLDAAEREAGGVQGRPRVKVTSASQLSAILGRGTS